MADISDELSEVEDLKDEAARCICSEQQQGCISSIYALMHETCLKNNGKALPLQIPHTIVFHPDGFLEWYHSDSKGRVLKVTDKKTTLDQIYNALVPKSNSKTRSKVRPPVPSKTLGPRSPTKQKRVSYSHQHPIIAQFTPLSNAPNGGNSIQYFDELSLHDFFNVIAEYAAEKAELDEIKEDDGKPVRTDSPTLPFAGVLQTFVGRDGLRKNTVYRSVWSPDSALIVQCKRNLYTLNDEQMSIPERAVTFDDLATCSVVQPILNSRIREDTHVAAKALAGVLAAHSKKLKPSYLEYFFKYTHDHQMVLLTCRSFYYQGRGQVTHSCLQCGDVVEALPVKESLPSASITQSSSLASSTHSLQQLLFTETREEEESVQDRTLEMQNFLFELYDDAAPELTDEAYDHVMSLSSETKVQEYLRSLSFQDALKANTSVPADFESFAKTLSRSDKHLFKAVYKSDQVYANLNPYRAQPKSKPKQVQKNKRRKKKATGRPLVRRRRRTRRKAQVSPLGQELREEGKDGEPNANSVESASGKEAKSTPPIDEHESSNYSSDAFSDVSEVANNEDKDDEDSYSSDSFSSQEEYDVDTFADESFHSEDADRVSPVPQGYSKSSNSLLQTVQAELRVDMDDKEEEDEIDEYDDDDFT